MRAYVCMCLRPYLATVPAVSTLSLRLVPDSRKMLYGSSVSLVGAINVRAPKYPTNSRHFLCLVNGVVWVRGHTSFIRRNISKQVEERSRFEIFCPMSPLMNRFRKWRNDTRLIRALPWELYGPGVNCRR